MNNKVFYIKDYASKTNNKRVGDSMCEILRQLQGKKPSQLLQEYGLTDEPPINLDFLLKKIGIHSGPMDFSNIERKSDVPIGSILGATIAKENRVNILYRLGDTENRRRFTIAHELAHCCLHTESLMSYHVELRETSDISINKVREYQANVFAGELLISEDSLQKIYNKLLCPYLSTFMKIYKVSSSVMRARLDYLNLPYYKDIVNPET